MLQIYFSKSVWESDQSFTLFASATKINIVSRSNRHDLKKIEARQVQTSVQLGGVDTKATGNWGLLTPIT